MITNEAESFYHLRNSLPMATSGIGARMRMNGRKIICWLMKLRVQNFRR